LVAFLKAVCYGNLGHGFEAIDFGRQPVANHGPIGAIVGPKAAGFGWRFYGEVELGAVVIPGQSGD